MNPEERTYPIEHKDKKYLIQLRSDKGQFLTDQEAQGIINSFNVNEFVIDALRAKNDGLMKQADDALLKKRRYATIVVLFVMYEVISFFL
jgi:hypothetical protein